tara:strand:+ start:117 stop:374 length:258 start_codon:yes stop_codon:yes gene_type:complete
MPSLKIFKSYDLVRSKIYSAGFLAPGPNQTFIEASKQKMFDGYALILDPVDPDVSDPTCKIMLSNGSTLRVRTEYLEIMARYREV